jgi:hypothetical protein
MNTGRNQVHSFLTRGFGYYKQPLPPSECTMERLEKAHFALVGTTSDIRREMDLLVETANPEWFFWQSDRATCRLSRSSRC